MTALLTKTPGVLRLALAAVLLAAAAGCAGKRGSQPELDDLMDVQRTRQEAMEDARLETEHLISSLEKPGPEVMGAYYLEQGRPERAYVEYLKALEEEPDRADLRYRTGRLLLDRGQVKEAEKHFKVIVEKDAESPLGHLALGRTRFAAGDLKGAEESLRTAIALDDGSWEAHAFLGIVYDHGERYGEAAREYETAVALKPSDPMLWNNLGVSLLLRNENLQALKALTEAQRLGGAEERIVNNLALALARLGRFDDALEMFRHGGGAARAYNNVGYFYLKEGKREEAVQALEKAISLRPEYYPSAHVNLKKARDLAPAGPAGGGER